MLQPTVGACADLQEDFQGGDFRGQRGELFPPVLRRTELLLFVRPGGLCTVQVNT
jgi:hypothetical protein